MGTQEVIYEWLMQVSGEHTAVEIAEGTGLDKIQAGNALTNLKRKNAVGGSNKNGGLTQWFAVPGASLSPSGDGEERTRDVQGIIYNWLMENPGAHHVQEIATGTELTPNQVSSAMYNLKKKGAATKEGDSVNTRWAGVSGADLGARTSNASVGPRRGSSPGALAKLKFEKALEAFIDAAVEIKDYIVVEDQKQELDELRAFKAQIEETMREAMRRK